MNTFQIATTANSLAFTNAQGATLKITFDGKQWYRENTEMEAKDYQYSLNIFKFIVDYTTNHVSKFQPKAKTIRNFADTVKGLKNCSNFRNLSNKLRKAYDNGKVMSHKDFQSKFFYEGTMNRPANTQVAAV